MTNHGTELQTGLNTLYAKFLLHFSCNEGYVSCIFEECIHRIGLVKQIDENYLTVIKLVLPEPEPELCVSLSMFEFDDLGAVQLSFFVSF